MILTGQRLDDYGTLTASTNGTQITSSGSANTKGSYAQLVASTTYPISGFLFMVTPAAAAEDFLIDIAKGSAGNEQIIVPDLRYASTHSSEMHVVFIPMMIPAGERIACRCASSGLSQQLRVSIIGVGLMFDTQLTSQVCDAYGTNASNSQGTSVDPGGTINTLGSYSQIVASTSRPHRFLLMAVGCQKNAAPASAGWLVNVARGGAGSEQVIIPNIRLQGGSASTQGGPTPQYVIMPCDLPAGERLAVNAQCSINDATDRLLDVALYGFD